MPANTYLASEKKGIAQVGDYATPVGDAAKVQALINLIEPEHTTTYRGLLDQMSPTARVQLLIELAALKAAVT